MKVKITSQMTIFYPDKYIVSKKIKAMLQRYSLQSGMILYSITPNYFSEPVLKSY